MRINPINTSFGLTKPLCKAVVAATCLLGAPIVLQKATPPSADEFARRELSVGKMKITEKGDTIKYPSSLVKIANYWQRASVVVDLSCNKLYHYKQDGELIKHYPIASGKPATPTHTAVAKILGVEYYPYKGAPRNSKRALHPKDYGSRIILLGQIDTETGKISGYNGEFIHGAKNESSIGKYVSGGCMRMLNKDVKELSSRVKNGEIVKIIK